MNSNSNETSFYLRKLVKSSLVVFIGIAIAKVLGYAYKIIVAKSFGAEVFGLFSIALVAVSVAVTIASFGFPEGLLRFISKYRGSGMLYNSKRIVLVALSLSLGLSIIASILLWFAAPYISTVLLRQPEVGFYLKIISFGLPCIIFSNLLLSVIRSFEDVKGYVLLSNVLGNALKIIFVLLLLYSGLKSTSVPLSYTISVFFLAIIVLVYSQKYLRSILTQNAPKRAKKESLKPFISYSWPFILTGLLGSLFYSTDSLVLGYYGTSAQVGYYNAAVSLITLFFVAPDLFTQLFLPVISSKFAQNKKGVITGLTRQLTKWIFIINLPLLLGFIIFPGVFLNLLFGQTFLVAMGSLQLLSLGAIFSGFVSVLSGIITMSGNSRLVLKDFCFAAFFNLLLNLMLIPLYGLEGAAIATSISWVIFMGMLFMQVKFIHKFNPFKSSFLRVFVSALIPLVIIFIIKRLLPAEPIYLVIIGIVALAIYLCSLIILKAFDEKDKEIIRAILIKAGFSRSTFP